MLEPAVGIGRILIPLLQAGIDIAGYDLFPAMLPLGEENCRIRGLEADLRIADMSQYVVADTYSAIIVPTGSIALLEGREPTISTLQGFHDSLTPDGTLVLDLPAPALVTEPEPLRTWQRGESTWTLQTLGVDFDASANRTTRWLRYDRWNNNALDASELLQFRLQHWSLAEFDTLLIEAGFTDITVIGDYSGPPTPGSSVWTFRARRR